MSFFGLSVKLVQGGKRKKVRANFCLEEKGIIENNEGSGSAKQVIALSGRGGSGAVESRKRKGRAWLSNIRKGKDFQVGFQEVSSR